MNRIMMKFLVAVKDHQTVGGFLSALTDLDPMETNIAVRVGVEYGWLTDDCKLTSAGHSILSEIIKHPLLLSEVKTSYVNRTSFFDLYSDRKGLSKSLYEHVRRNMPSIMMAALVEVHCGGNNVEAFEKKNELPQRSCRTIIECALENYDLIMKQTGFRQ